MDFTRVRKRLTFLYTVILGGISIITVSILFISMWLSIETTNSNSLRGYALQLASAYSLKSAGIQSDDFQSILDALADEDVTYLIYNDNFDIVLASENYPINSDTAFYLVQKFFDSVHENGEITDFDRGRDSFKICTDAYVSSSGELIMVQLIKNMSSQRALIQGPLLVAIMTVILGIIISFLVGNYLARRSLRPIMDNYNRQQTFIANASHELRTPLAVILTNLEAAESEEEVSQQKIWINNALTEVKFARNVISDLLFLSRADMGEVTLRDEPVDLSYKLLETTEKLDFLAREKQISLITDIADSEIFVKGDPEWITELLTILIDNAIKYTGEGGKIIVTLAATQSTVTVQVIDNGIGIEQDQQDKIFDRFYRVDKARSRKIGGTGLGLSIARLICQRENIVLSVKSKPGEGSTFSLVFERYYQE